jgi:hypothetical protein
MKPPLLTRDDALTALLVFVMGVGIFVTFVGLKWLCFAIPLGLATAFLGLHLVHGLKKRSKEKYEAKVVAAFKKAAQEYQPKADAEDDIVSLDEFRWRRRTRADDRPDDDDPDGKSAA